MLNMFDFVLQQWSRIVQDQLQPNLSPLGALPSVSSESASERERQTVTGSSSLALPLPPSLPLSVSAESSLQVLEEGCDVSQGSLRSLSMAVSLFSLLCAMQTVQTTNSKEDAQQRAHKHTHSQVQAEELLSLYLSLLQRVRAWSAEHALSQQSFSAQGKQVVVLEGLSLAGKSAIAHVLRETIGPHVGSLAYTHAPVAMHTQTPTTFSSHTQQQPTHTHAHTQPEQQLLADILRVCGREREIAQAVLLRVKGVSAAAQTRIARVATHLVDFLSLYLLSLRVLLSAEEQRVFIVEKYFHHFLALQLQRVALRDKERETERAGNSNGNRERKSLSPSAVSWPLDLPMPDIVLYLTTTRNIRLQRARALFPHVATADDLLSTSVEMDDYLQSVYMSVRGPGTVGVDSSGDIESVYGTVVEALDFYGLYALTRSPAAALPLVAESVIQAQESSLRTGEEGEGGRAGGMYDAFAYLSSEMDNDKPTQAVEEVNEDALFLGCGFEDVCDDSSGQRGVSLSPQKRRKTKARAPVGTESHGDRRGSTRRGRESLLLVAQKPMLSQEEIHLRRVSVGVYGMYSSAGCC